MAGNLHGENTDVESQQYTSVGTSSLFASHRMKREIYEMIICDEKGDNNALHRVSWKKMVCATPILSESDG
jgi:hypothetical protein